MNLIERNQRYTSVHFKSLTELVNAECDTSHKHQFYHYRDGADSRGSSWLGFSNRTNADVVKHALLGDKEVYDNVTRKLAILRPFIKEQEHEAVVKKRKRKRTRGPQGDEVDIHRIYQGQADKAWTSRKIIEVDKKHHLITIMIDVGGNSMVDANESLWRAAAAILVTDTYIKAGKAVRIMIGSSTSGLDVGTPYTQTSIVVKQYNEPLSMERLAAMSHVGFHRTFNFAARCMIEGRYYNPGDCQSNGLLENQAPLQLESELQEPTTTKYIYIPRCTSQWDAESVIKKYLGKQAAQAA